jgi:Secretion system C-terminal sorting domain/Bacterial Ig domain
MKKYLLLFFFAKSFNILQAQENIKLFGYFTGGIYPNQVFADQQNLANNNLVIIQFDPYSFSNNLATLQNAQNNNYQKVIFTMDQFFYSLTPGSAANPLTIYDQSTFDAKFDFIQQSIQGFENIVYALYFDEPVWNNYDQTKFVDLTLRLKNRFPNIRRMIFEAYPAVAISPETAPAADAPFSVQLSSSWLQHISDVGFDEYRYTRYENTGNPISHKVRNQERLGAVASMASNNQRLWLVPDAFLSEENCPNGTSFLDSALQDFYEIGIANNRVFGIIPYYYWYPVNVGQYTTSQLFDNANLCFSPSLKQKHLEIGQNVIGQGQDITAPEIPIINAITSTTPGYQIIGTAEPNTIVKIYDDAGFQYVTTTSNGVFSTNITLQNYATELKLFSVDSSDNWSNPVRFFIDSTLSLEANRTEQNHFQVFPNPATQILNIQNVGSNDFRTENIQLSNVLGENIRIHVIDETKNSAKLNVSDLENGIYFISYEGAVKKILKY